jgi:type IV secretory pathway TraG/TraD family ATPase VirD4
MSRLTPQNAEAESKALAAALFIPAEGERRDHWFNAAQQLFALLIMFVYFSPDIPAQKKDLLAVRRGLLGNLKPSLEAMLQMDDCDGLLRDLALSFLETPPKEFGSVVSAAQRQTDILDNPEMIACLSASGKGDEVDFKQWHSGTMTVFLCLSAPKFPVFNRWLRLVLTSALDEMTDKLNPPPLPVAFMLDELATLGHFQPIENAIGLAAGYGVQLICVFQDVAQMRDLYKSRWASFIGNAGVRALFNLDDFDSAKYWSNFIGGHLVETRGRQEDLYGLSKGDNVGEALRPLLSPEEIMLHFGRNHMLVLPQASRPIIAERVAYWNDHDLAGLWDDPRQPAKRGPSPPPPHPVPNGPWYDPLRSAPPPPSPKGQRPPAPRPPAPPFLARSLRTAQPDVTAAQNVASTQPAAQQKTPVEVDRYQSGDIVYVMFDDGSVEVRAPTGASRYPSLQALREAAATPEAPPSEQIIDP